MNYLATISDKDVFPDKEVKPVSEWALRKTVKIIIQNDDGKIALVTNPVHNFFLLPGGGIEDGESVIAAAERESKEEALCSIMTPNEFGIIEEYRARDGKRYETHGVVAKAGESVTDDLRTDDEKKNGLNVVWLSFDEAEEKMKWQNTLLQEDKVDFYNTGFNIVRDYVFFKTAKERWLLMLC
jgi:ADP-ribose pyrophosphatase YjhB (NUDIX family)